MKKSIDVAVHLGGLLFKADEELFGTYFFDYENIGLLVGKEATGWVVREENNMAQVK